MMADPPEKGNEGDETPERGVAVKVRPKTKKPSMYRVLLMNDDYTPMEFVVDVLMKVFNKTAEEATRIMLNVHKPVMLISTLYEQTSPHILMKTSKV